MPWFECHLTLTFAIELYLPKGRDWLVSWTHVFPSIRPPPNMFLLASKEYFFCLFNIFFNLLLVIEQS